jgi:hypothetical protein
MFWGRPPLQNDSFAKPKDLQKHGFYETYYLEFQVSFALAPQCGNYNVQSEVGDPSTFMGSGLYYQSFDVDVSDLAAGYGFHFDLYQVVDSQATTFAPFSHDAQSGSIRQGLVQSVPDGGQGLLF